MSIRVRSRNSLENHTRFQTKTGKGFFDQKGPKTLPFWQYKSYLYGLYKGEPLRPDPFHDC